MGGSFVKWHTHTPGHTGTLCTAGSWQKLTVLGSSPWSDPRRPLSPHLCIGTGHLQALAFLGLQLELQQAFSTRLLVRRHRPLCVGQRGSRGPRREFSFQCHLTVAERW